MKIKIRENYSELGITRPVVSGQSRLKVTVRKRYKFVVLFV